MKIGGNNSGVVKGVSVNSDGAIFTTRKIAVTQIFNSQELRNQSYVRSNTTVDLSGGVFVSLRVLNTLKYVETVEGSTVTTDIPVTLRLYTDGYDSNGTTSSYQYDVSDNGTTVTVPAAGHRVIVTPDDLPVLPYLNLISLGVKATATPNDGSVSVWAVVKG